MGITTLPKVTTAPGSTRVEWETERALVCFDAKQVRSHTDGRITCNLTVSLQLPSGDNHVPSFGQMNLVSGQTRKALWRTIAEREPDLDPAVWDRIGEETARLICEQEEQTYEVERLAATDRLSPTYLLGCLLEGVANLIFAAGASGKSLLGLLFAILLENGLTLDLQPGPKVNALYLDYETSRSETARRSTLLVQGLEAQLPGRKLVHPLYGRGLGTLADRVSDVARVVAENDIGLLIVDSAGAAAGGDILTAETAVRFFDGVRTTTASTGATSLIFSHVTKADSRQDDSQRAPVGSVFFSNLSRLVWELRPQETGREDVLQAGLFCRKANSGRLPPMGFRFKFEEGAIKVDTCEAADVATEAGATRSLIVAELNQGPTSISALADATGATAGAVRQHIFTMKQRGQVEPVSRGVYRLVES